jgi:hypothetical protein
MLALLALCQLSGNAEDAEYAKIRKRGVSKIPSVTKGSVACKLRMLDSVCGTLAGAPF